MFAIVICLVLLMCTLIICVACEGARVTAVLVWGPGEVWLR